LICVTSPGKVGFLRRLLKYLHGLRGDLEKVRMLADFARKREREKSRSANIISNFVDSTMFPFDGQLQTTLEQISTFVYSPVLSRASTNAAYFRMDRNHYFSNPVSPDQAPDYHNIIERPMYWDKIKQKLDQREYVNLQDFKVLHMMTHIDLFHTFPCTGRHLSGSG